MLVFIVALKADDHSNEGVNILNIYEQIKSIRDLVVIWINSVRFSVAQLLGNYPSLIYK